MKNIFYIAWILIFFGACSKKVSTEEIITKYINDTLCAGVRITNIQIVSSFDSIIQDIQDNSSYRETENHLYEYYSKLEHEITDYNHERAMGWGSGVNKDIVKLYQEFVRNDLNRLKELKESYTPKFKGFGCYAKIRYETDFGDSIFIGRFCLSPKKNRILNAEVYPIPTNLNIDSLIELDRHYKISNYSTAIDTTIFVHF